MVLSKFGILDWLKLRLQFGNFKFKVGAICFTINNYTISVKLTDVYNQTPSYRTTLRYMLYIFP